MNMQVAARLLRDRSPQYLVESTCEHDQAPSSTLRLPSAIHPRICQTLLAESKR
jgi:hypothetical protein